MVNGKLASSFVLVALLVAGVGYYGHTRFHAGERAGKQGMADVLRLQAIEAQRVADVTMKRTRAMLADQKAKIAAMDHVIADNEKRLEHDRQVSDHIIASLRAGTLKLRQRWRDAAIPRADGLPATDERVAGADARYRLREASVGRIIGIVTACQTQRDSLKQAIRVLTGQ